MVATRTERTEPTWAQKIKYLSINVSIMIMMMMMIMIIITWASNIYHFINKFYIHPLSSWVQHKLEYISIIREGCALQNG